MTARNQRRLAAALATLLTGLSACSERNSGAGLAPADFAERGIVAEAPTLHTQAEVDQLRALGYVGFGDEKVDPDAPALLAFDPARSEPGYSLISNRDLRSAELISAEGRVVHRWAESSGHGHWSNVELLSSGDILVAGNRAPDADDSGGSFLLHMSFDGRTLWRTKLPAHHDVERIPDGRIATLTYRFRQIPAIDEKIMVRDNDIALLSVAGEVVEEYSLYSLLASRPDLFRFQPVAALTRFESTQFIDLLHANSIEWMHHAHLEERDPLYAASNVLVSFRHQDTIAIFNWSEKKLVWAWGQGQISGQHDASVLENGNILLFDNGLDRGWSRVIELDPLARKIVWEYRAKEKEAFFSLRKGSSQRLEKGNTLVASSDRGEAFEVTPDGEIVWHFLNPHSDSEGNRATIVRIKRYPPALIEPLLRRGTRHSPGQKT